MIDAEISFVMYDKIKRKMLIIVKSEGLLYGDQSIFGGENYEGSVVQKSAFG